MKLELKHLAPYLPHGLEMIDLLHWGDDEIPWRKCTLSSLSVNDKDNPSIDEWWNEEGDNYYFSSDFKPILRPLSDLTDLKGLNHLGFSGLQNLKADLNTINVMTFEDVQYLISKHYDVFGLIEKGLAIDINTINTKQNEQRNKLSTRS